MFTKIDGGKTKAVLYSKVDPVLSMIPQSFVEKGSADSGYLIQYLSEYLEKNKK